MDKVITLVACCLCAVTTNAQFYLNERHAAYDSLTHTYLFAVEESLLASKSFPAIVTLDSDSAWYDVAINGVVVSTGDTLRLDIASGNSFPLTAKRGDGENITAQVSFTCMPIVCLRGEFGYDYSEGTVSLYMPYALSETEDDYCEMSAKLKWRGASTNSQGKHKRNYHIKFLKDDGTKKNRQFFGLRKDNDWILDANQVDMARCRNRVATDLWNEICTPPHYAAYEPGVLSGTRGRMVELFLNNEYRGIYAMTENLDAKQMCLVDYDETTGTHHGHLWKTVAWGASQMYTSMAFDATLEESNGFETKYPDFDDVSPTDYSIISDAVRFVAESSDEDFSDSVAFYLDLPVVVDYFIFLDVTLAIDNSAKNMFYACYDEQESRKLTLAVWDLDCTFGQHYTNSDGYYRTSTLGPETDYMSTWCSSKLFARLMEFDWFNSMVEERYAALRGDVMTAASLSELFSDVIGMYLNCGAAAREAARWNGDTDISGRNLDFEEELEYIEQWIYSRMAYLDGKYQATGIIDSTIAPPVDDKIYNIYGQSIHTTPDDLPRGIYILKGKKFVVR